MTCPIRTARFLMLAAALALASCARTGKTELPKQVNPINPATGKPLIRTNVSDGVPVAAGGNIQDQPLLSFDEDDIIYTDPDNPEAGIPELETLLAVPKSGPWLESETLAKQRSVREGKPLLIWFTDSQSSPMCKALSQELFSRHEFGDWATENLVRLKVDANIQVKDAPDIDSRIDRETRIKNYVADLKKRYKIMGYPSLVMLSPGGEVVGRYRGYKRGEADLLWGQFKYARNVAEVSYRGWRKSMEAKGYREWTGRDGRTVFAKLTSYSNGRLTLVEPDGTRSKTAERNLSDADRGWIAEQKKLRASR